MFTNLLVTKEDGLIVLNPHLRTAVCRSWMSRPRRPCTRSSESGRVSWYLRRLGGPDAAGGEPPCEHCRLMFLADFSSFDRSTTHHRHRTCASCQATILVVGGKALASS
jgi:hypothetical protein